MPSNQVEPIRILRLPAVVTKTGLSKSTIYGRLRCRDFPEPVSLGRRATGFLEHEVEAWLQNLVAQSRTAPEAH